MKHVKVNDKKVPALGFGTWQIEGDECRKAVKNALDIGYRHIDTAQAYENEEYVGEGIQESDVDREDIWLTTKVWRNNLNEDRLKESVKESLEKLQTEYVDLLLIHWPFENMDLEAVLKKMNELVDEGKVKNIGISNFNTDQMDEAVNLSDEPVFTNQVEYHPFLNQDAVLEKCREHGMMLTAYSPLARGDVPENKTLKEIGERYGKSPVQVTLRWLIQQEDVAAIPKASSPEHQEANFEIFDFELDEDEMEEISELYREDRKIDPGFAPDWD